MAKVNLPLNASAYVYRSGSVFVPAIPQTTPIVDSDEWRWWLCFTVLPVGTQISIAPSLQTPLPAGFPVGGSSNVWEFEYQKHPGMIGLPWGGIASTAGLIYWHSISIVPSSL